MTEWTERDRELAIGLVVLEETTFMGFPIKQVYSMDSDGHYVAEKVINHAQAAVDRARAKDKEAEPGAEYVVWDLRVTPEKAHLEG